MRGAGVLLIALAGCDRVLLLSHVDHDARARGDTDLADGDAPPDGIESVACATPTPLAAPGTVVLAGFTEGTISESGAFGIAIATGNAYYVTEADSPVPVGPQSAAWNRPALTPDGSQLYMYNVSGQVYRFEHVATSTWMTGVTTAPSIPSFDRPGNAGVVPGTAELRMMVYEGTELREHASINGGRTWPIVSSVTRSLTDLTGLPAGGVIDYPSLTADARTLVFTVSGTAMDGVWYIRRSTFDINNNFSTANTVEYGRLLPTPGVKSPFLTMNCSLIVGEGNELVRYDPPL